MLDDWPQECVADAKASVRRKIKIGKAPFQRGRQNSSCDADGLERVGKCVGRDDGTDGHILRKINHTIGKARERNVRAGSFQLHLIDEVCEQGAVFRQRQRIFCRNRHHRAGQPVYRASGQSVPRHSEVRLRQPEARPILPVSAGRRHGRFHGRPLRPCRINFAAFSGGWQVYVPPI